MLIFDPLPACLGHARNFTTEGNFPQFVTTQTEFTENTTRTTGLLAAITLTTRTGVTRQLLQLETRGHALLVRQLGVVDLLEESSTLGRELSNHLCALLFAIDQRQFRHNTLSS